MEQSAIGILLIGKMGSGKGVVSDMLCKELGFNRHSIATWLKETIKSHYNLDLLRKNDLIKLGNGKEITVRRALQLFGTEYVRGFDPNWHVDETINSIRMYTPNTIGEWQINPPYRFVIDDIRFHNEIERLTVEYKCVTIRIEADELTRVQRICVRDGLVPTTEQMSHASETELDGLVSDYVITNNGSLNDLESQVKEVMQKCGIMK